MDIGWRLLRIFVRIMLSPIVRVAPDEKSWFAGILKSLLLPERLEFVDGEGKGEPELSVAQMELAARLRAHLETLCLECGERNINNMDGLEKAAERIFALFSALGYDTEYHQFEVSGKLMRNIVAEKKGARAPGEIVVVGAHYDTVKGSSGADDNASGVAALLELARAMREDSFRRTVRFIAFANEEHLSGTKNDMGSAFYARKCRERDENIVAMLSLEMLGYYSVLDDSQRYPPPLALLFPDKGDFIAFVGDIRSSSLMRRCIEVFRSISTMPSQGASMPGIFKDAARSDHASFWEQGYPALVVTDTAEFRNHNYHTGGDTIETLDLIRFTLVVDGLKEVVRDLLAGRKRFGYGTALSIVNRYLHRSLRLFLDIFGISKTDRRIDTEEKS